mmetsp:Transcript_23780/g.68331  ORF Transcript_23780/g.68331 Transcript_23780/m.68331 type:complete len:395 (+) Transcript_23780:1210-2394(+)
MQTTCDDVTCTNEAICLKQILLPPLHGLDGPSGTIGHAVQLPHPALGAFNGLAIPRQLLGDGPRRPLRIGHDAPGMVQRGILRGQRRVGPLCLLEQRRPVRVGGGRPALGGGAAAAIAIATGDRTRTGFALLLVAELVLVGRRSLGLAVARLLVPAGLVVVGELGHLACVARPLLDLLCLLGGTPATRRIGIGGTIIICGPTSIPTTLSLLLLEANLLRRFIHPIGIPQPRPDGPAFRPQRGAHVAAPVQPMAQLRRHGLPALPGGPRRPAQGLGDQPPLDLHGIEMIGRLAQQHRRHLHVLHVRHHEGGVCAGTGIVLLFWAITTSSWRAVCGCARFWGWGVMAGDLGQRTARLGHEGDELLLVLVKGSGHGSNSLARTPGWLASSSPAFRFE